MPRWRWRAGRWSTVGSCRASLVAERDDIGRGRAAWRAERARGAGHARRGLAGRPGQGPRVAGRPAGGGRRDRRRRGAGARRQAPRAGGVRERLRATRDAHIGDEWCDLRGAPPSSTRRPTRGGAGRDRPRRVESATKPTGPRAAPTSRAAGGDGGPRGDPDAGAGRSCGPSWPPLGTRSSRRRNVWPGNGIRCPTTNWRSRPRPRRRGQRGRGPGAGHRDRTGGDRAGGGGGRIGRGDTSGHCARERHVEGGQLREMIAQLRVYGSRAARAGSTRRGPSTSTPPPSTTGCSAGPGRCNCCSR